jgi:uncharacterized lipoprotein YbaY
VSSAPGPTVHISGAIRLERDEVFRDATAVVGLDDVTQVDAPSRRIAETKIEHLRGQHAAIPFKLVAAFVPSSRASYVLSAEIREGAAGGLRSGDYVNQIACPWTPDQTEDAVIPVRKIRT